MDVMDTIRQTFFQECSEQLTEMESGLLVMSEGEADSDTINAVFRAVHSIKGGAGAFKLEALVQFAHKFETALDHIRSGKLAAGGDVMKVLLRAADILSDLVDASRDNVAIEPDTWQASADELLALTASADGAEDEDDFGSIDFQPALIDFGDTPSDGIAIEPLTSTFNIGFRPKPELYGNANETILVLRELSRMGTTQIACDTSDIPSLDDIDPAGAYISWTIALDTTENADAVASVFEFVDTDADISIEQPSSFSLPDLPEPFKFSASTDAPVEVAEVIESVEAPSAVVEAAPVIREEATAPVVPFPAAAPPQQTAAKTDAKPAALATIRVEFDRVDRLINLVGELVINQAMLSQRVAESNISNSSPIAVGLEELEQLTREIQEGVMGISAQPVKPLFQRMGRIVREVSDATGKEVRFKTEGDATEVDKTVVERLSAHTYDPQRCRPRLRNAGSPRCRRKTS